MTPPAAVVLLLAAALVAWPDRAVAGPARLRALTGTSPASTGPAGSPPEGRRRWLFAAAAGCAVLLLTGPSPLGFVLAGGATVGAERLLRRAEPDPGAATAAECAAEIPIAADLLAVCLAAGLPVGGAVGAVSAALAGPLGPELAEVAARAALGSAPRAAWAGVSSPVAALGRVLIRAGESGSAAVPALHALAADARAEERGRTEARVRRAGIWVLAPLGACFLPAFVCLGVAPMVLGLAADVLP